MNELIPTHLEPRHYGIFGSILIAIGAFVRWFIKRAPWKKGVKVAVFLDTAMEKFNQIEEGQKKWQQEFSTSVIEQARGTRELLSTVSGQMTIATDLMKSHSDTMQKFGELTHNVEDMRKDVNGWGAKLAGVKQDVSGLHERVGLLERTVDDLDDVQEDEPKKVAGR